MYYYVQDGSMSGYDSIRPIVHCKIRGIKRFQQSQILLLKVLDEVGSESHVTVHRHDSLAASTCFCLDGRTIGGNKPVTIIAAQPNRNTLEQRGNGQYRAFDITEKSTFDHPKPDCTVYSPPEPV